MACISKNYAVQGRCILTRSIPIALAISAIFAAQNAIAVEATFGGQYRINSYHVSNSEVTSAGDMADATASRLRIRQNIDLQFDKNFGTHFQFELGHTRANITTTVPSNAADSLSYALRVRHAFMSYKFDNKVRGEAGIVPLSDYFGDTLYSSDWNFNPLAGVLYFPAGAGKVRLSADNLAQGSEITRTPGDFALYTADYIMSLGGKNQINIGGAWSRIAVPTDPSNPRRNSFNYGVGAHFNVADGIDLNGFILGSRTDRALLGGIPENGSGVATKLELVSQVGTGTIGIMGTYATGKSDGAGFQPTMALAKTNGYWGYTGILTVQGPTDTGFDGDSVNISNNGYGLATVQAKYSFPMTNNLKGYMGAGWFGGSKAAGRSGAVGADIIAMGTYRFNKILALDFGADYAKIKDGDSGYYQGAAGAFNQLVGMERSKMALFSRLQAEF